MAHTDIASCSISIGHARGEIKESGYMHEESTLNLGYLEGSVRSITQQVFWLLMYCIAADCMVHSDTFVKMAMDQCSMNVFKALVVYNLKLFMTLPVTAQ